VAHDAIQPLDRRGDPEMILDPHPEADDRVPRLQGGGQAVSRGVGDRDAEPSRGNLDEVVKVAADLLRGDGSAVDVERPERGRRVGKEGELDLLHLRHPVLEVLLADFQVHDVADRVQRVDDLLRLDGGLQAERDDLAALLPDADRREDLDPDRLLDLAVDPGIRDVLEGEALLQDLPDRGVGDGDAEAERGPPGRVFLFEDVNVVAADVDPASDDPEIVLEVGNQAAQDRRQGRQEVLGVLERGEGLLELPEQVLVVHEGSKAGMGPERLRYQSARTRGNGVPLMVVRRLLTPGPDSPAGCGGEPITIRERRIGGRIVHVTQAIAALRPPGHSPVNSLRTTMEWDARFGVAAAEP